MTHLKNTYTKFGKKGNPKYTIFRDCIKITAIEFIQVVAYNQSTGRSLVENMLKVINQPYSGGNLIFLESGEAMISSILF